jgi:hypothetical protein
MLDSIAATIASRRLSINELGGAFRLGAKELAFADGQPVRTSLAVGANDIGAVIERHRTPVA